MKKILVTGGQSRFAKALRSVNTNHKFIYRNKKELNINSLSSINNNIKQFKPDYILHLAGLSRPMIIHEKNLSKSIELNIIGTCNLVNACYKKNLKLIYFSTSYVYPGTKGNYKENDPLLPWNNYGWSKLGGECAVQMYKNSLILRVSMTERPFIHKYAYSNVKTNFIFQDELAKIFVKLINKKGIINIGGPSKTVFKFASKYNKNIKKRYSKGEFPKKMDMSLLNLKKILEK